MNSSPLSVVLSQITAAKLDLRQYQPDSVDWGVRASAAVKVIIPWLVENAEALRTFVAGVLNAPLELRRLWKQVQLDSSLPDSIRLAIDQQLEWDDVLRDTVSGEIVSKVVTKFILNHNTEFRSNGRSDYPDLYLSTVDYTTIPNGTVVALTPVSLYRYPRGVGLAVPGGVLASAGSGGGGV